MRPLSCAELNVTVLSITITAIICCKQMSGISRLFTIAASSVASRTETCCTSFALKGRCFRRISRASRAAWIGEPTGHFLMFVRMISKRSPSCSVSPRGSA